jgi:hypothetical protein
MLAMGATGVEREIQRYWRAKIQRRLREDAQIALACAGDSAGARR